MCSARNRTRQRALLSDFPFRISLFLEQNPYESLMPNSCKFDILESRGLYPDWIGTLYAVLFLFLRHFVFRFSVFFFHLSVFLIFLFRLSFFRSVFDLLLLMLFCHFRHLSMIVQAPFSIGSSSALCQTLHSGFHEINGLNRRLCGFFSMTDSCPEYAVSKARVQSFLNLWMAETGFSANPSFDTFLLSGHFFVHPAVQLSPMEAFASFHLLRLLPGCAKPVFKSSAVRILIFSASL